LQARPREAYRRSGHGEAAKTFITKDQKEGEGREDTPPKPARMISISDLVFFASFAFFASIAL
jgi:hypothetical protein